MNKRIVVASSAMAAMLLAAAPRGMAAEAGQSPYLKGYRDILAGIIPPDPGVYFRDDLIYYSGSASRVVLGGKVDAGLDIDSVYEIPSFTAVTDLKIFGGQYAFGVAPTLINADVKASAVGPLVSGSRSESDFAIGDTVITPATLGWHFANNTHFNLGVSVFAPTGDYEKGRLANTSLHYWAVMPAAGFSYFNPKSGWDASIAATYVLPFKNDAHRLSDRQILHFDGALTKGFGAWRLGGVAYAMIQTTGDSGSGAQLGSFKSSVLRHRSDRGLFHETRRRAADGDVQMGSRVRRQEHLRRRHGDRRRQP